MTAKTSFRGSFTALVTPFKNGSVDEKALSANWSTGRSPRAPTASCRSAPPAKARRSPTTSTSRSSNGASRRRRGRVPVIAGAGSNSTAEAIDLAQHAEKAGADAVLVVTPYYNKPTQEGLYQHFKAINDAIGIPIIIYNIPARSVVDMSVDTMKRLFELQEHRRREGRDRQCRAGLAAARGHGPGFQPALRRGRDRARLHGAWRPRLHLGDLERGAAALRGVPGRLPQGRLCAPR